MRIPRREMTSEWDAAGIYNVQIVLTEKRSAVSSMRSVACNLRGSVHLVSKPRKISTVHECCSMPYSRELVKGRLKEDKARLGLRQVDAPAICLVMIDI